MLKQRYIGRGMHLEFCHPEYKTPIVTSRIEEISECPRKQEMQTALGAFQITAPA